MSTAHRLSRAEREHLHDVSTRATPAPWRTNRRRTVIVGANFEHEEWVEDDEQGFSRLALGRLGVVASACNGCGSRPIVTEADAAFVIAARGAVSRLLAERDELATLLRRVEFAATREGGAACPICGHPSTPERRHDPGCELAAALEKD